MPNDDLLELLTARMNDARADSGKHSDYWLPLAVPTYGVEEILQAVDSMVTFRTSMWEKTRHFEDMFASTYGGEAVMVNSGSSADLLMIFANLEQCGGPLRAGDEVCIPAVTWPTHLWSVLMAGLKPILVDVDPMSLNMSVPDLKAKVTDRTRAIFPVHLMGNPADMNAIKDVADSAGAIILEDCCEALGSRLEGRPVGTLGTAGSFSFFFSHHMTTMEGGMILTTDQDLAERLRLVRAHGWSRNIRYPNRNKWDLEADGVELDPRYTFVEWGFNVRPTELQAGFGIEQMKRLSSFEAHRAANYRFFSQVLDDRGLSKFLTLPVVLAEAEPSWFALPLLVGSSSKLSRDEIAAYLDEAGVETRPIVAGNLARHPVRRRFPEVFSGSFAGADVVHNQGFYVGLYPTDMRAELTRLVDLLHTMLA